MGKSIIENRHDPSIKDFFTNVSDIRKYFENSVDAPTLDKKILLIEGKTGIGKTALSDVFYFYCFDKKIPVGLATLGEPEIKSLIDLFYLWSVDLESSGHKLSKFTNTYNNYQKLKKKGDGILDKKTQPDISPYLFSAIKTVVTPTPNNIVDFAEKGYDIIYKKLKEHNYTNDDVSFYLDPFPRLCKDFYNDIEELQNKYRIVLIIDAYDSKYLSSDIENKINKIAQYFINKNIYLVIIGQDKPKWDSWVGWMRYASIMCLEKFDYDDMRELIINYSSYLDRDKRINENVIERINNNSHGIPIASITYVNTLFQNPSVDLNKIELIANDNLLNHLVKNLSLDVVKILKIASMLRWINEEIIKFITGNDNIGVSYLELEKNHFLNNEEHKNIHEFIRKIFEKSITKNEPEYKLKIHYKASEYYESLCNLDKLSISSLDYFLEYLYHISCVDQEKGLDSFVNISNKLCRIRDIFSLRRLVNDVSTYKLSNDKYKMWLIYFQSRLAYFEHNYSECKLLQKKILSLPKKDELFYAYTIADRSEYITSPDKLKNPAHLNKVLNILQVAKDNIPTNDWKIIHILSAIRRIYNYCGEYKKATDDLLNELEVFKQKKVVYIIVHILSLLKEEYCYLGNWEKSISMVNEGKKIFPNISSLYIYKRLIGLHNTNYVWSGRYNESEKGIRKFIDSIKSEKNLPIAELGFILGLQDKYNESFSELNKGIQRYNKDTNSHNYATIKSWLGYINIRFGNYIEAEKCLKESIRIKTFLKEFPEIIELYLWMGYLYETMYFDGSKNENKLKAEKYYDIIIFSNHFDREYIYCKAIIGLLRIKLCNSEFIGQETTNLLNTCKEISNFYEYNDILSYISLIQGHIQLEKENITQEQIILYYKMAMIYALRYNRYLLDEVFWGRNHGNVIESIVNICSRKNNFGINILNSLLKWWKTGINDLEGINLSKISPIPNNISLIEAEKIARENEPGYHGSNQTYVLNCLEESNFTCDL
jgi:tetratricopeptide (TPR) repeat protein